jgi:ATP-binding cassette, subfamily B, bacterial
MKTSNNPTPSLSHFIFTIIKPYKRWLSLMALVGLLWAFISTFIPYVLKLMIDHAVAFHADKSALFHTLLPYFFLYISLWIAQSLNMRLLDFVKLKFYPSVREGVIVKMFDYSNQHSHQYFQNNFAGSISNKILDMHGAIVEILTTLDDAYAQILGMSVAVVTLLFIHPIFAVILVGWTIAFIVITLCFLKPIQHLSQVLSESASTSTGHIVDSFSNIANVRLFARHREENHYIHRSIKQTVQNDRAMQTKIIYMRLWWDVSIILLLGLNLFILVDMYSKNLISIGDFTFVMTLSVSILWNLWFLASQFVSFSTYVGKCQQALSVVAVPHDIVDVVNAKPLIVSQGKIAFHDVTFHYDEGIHLFANKNVVIEAGQKVGLVGFSGSGKSTFVNLILRLFEVESGSITIDNQNIHDVTQQSLREQIALIPQDITLFHRTLMENIRFGNPTASEDEVIEIAKKAHCHEFISQLLHGYQSLVGERGVKLSGGQRQRIAIARAMLKNAPILILDEATSALDSVTEKYIQDALHILMQGKTTIVIAHRLSTLASLDRILVFDEGKIIEDGTHASLITKNGHYARMWHMQAGGFLPESKE